MFGSSKSAFLQVVRKAVARGNLAGQPRSAPERNDIGYQGGGDDLLQNFCDQLKLAGGYSYAVADPPSAIKVILDLVQKSNAKNVLLGPGPHLDALDLASALEAAKMKVTAADKVNANECDAFFEADIGISAVDYLIAETGTIVVSSKADDPRSLSLLPPVHIAVATREQILPDLFDWFDAVEENGLDKMPSGAALITGPSKTGDIELKLVTGVHGPGEVHAIVIVGN